MQSQLLIPFYVQALRNESDLLKQIKTIRLIWNISLRPWIASKLCDNPKVMDEEILRVFDKIMELEKEGE